MTTARDIMHAGAECINEDESLLVASRMMRDLDVGSLPICGNDDRLHGIITDRDIVLKCCAEGKNPADMKASDLANGAPHCVMADADINQVLRTMQSHQIRRVPVLEGKRLVGMISEADVGRHLSEDQIAQFVESVYAAR
ncbi:CBS domain-containing protein [Actinokineospora alba]|uniref:CBS domain-containing protein n=2 Tax=Actinokineospora TaxID=39845 RepID=A0A1H0QM64_9PSEU|nr:MULTISPECIES: CBS domain-containing protein [Actinokineospora]MBC6451379.1 CBS domain-containing protein [Actinokineospora xionganensis]TDP70496.1 CBS domain protein [Actinokineospora alba]SDI30028.1 CBS domain-containing protein [Actinokineospora alba]SDP18145.1 CBS domain-containing protein [Actinokineospora alba]